ncbi:hypothetical protein EYF80_061402 [Liparis tanakae]|uniref:Tumor protein p53-inducible protein 13 n=1 Tax=Liparis tanakae TaxID=230148 RepID=A0A4Z2EIK7_9TELE|nr:hypothetical protein EYF80_061402 [Liparis tanakae]
MEAEPESNVKRRTKERGQRRRIRAAVKGEEGNEREDTITHPSNRTTDISGSRDIRNHNFTLGPPADPPEIQNTNQTTGHEDEDEGTDSAEQREKHFVKQSVRYNVSKADVFGGRRGDGAVDVKERELEPEPTHSDTHPDGDGKDSGAAGAVSKKGLPRTPRTPRTDEAAWAAAALGFLLILLTLSVLHTRLYRHWRTAPSLYWRDTQQDYDSVADVIRRRIRIANTRWKRGRRRECVLLPSSSSSDESP